MNIPLPCLLLAVSALAVAPPHGRSPAVVRSDFLAPLTLSLASTEGMVPTAPAEGHTSSTRIPLLTAIVVLAASLVTFTVGCGFMVWRMSSSNTAQKKEKGPLPPSDGDRAAGRDQSLGRDQSRGRDQTPGPVLSLQDSESLTLLAVPVVSILASLAIVAWAFATGDVRLNALPILSLYTALQLIFNFIVKAVEGGLKWAWLRALGMNSAEIATCMSANEFDCDLIAKYGNGKIMILDGIVRKSGHVLQTTFVLAFWFAMPTEYAVPVGCMAGAGLLVLEIAFINSEGFFASYVLYCWARIRDGRLRRWNVLSVGASGAFTTIVTLCMWRTVLAPAIGNDLAQKTLLLVVTAPLQIGDAMAEVVGVLIGYHRFPVLGLGETNDKSVEGCIGMFASTALYSLGGIYITEQPLGPWWLLVIVISFSTMVMETLTPRGFDNFTIPATALLCAAVALQMGWSPIA